MFAYQQEKENSHSDMWEKITNNIIKIFIKILKSLNGLSILLFVSFPQFVPILIYTIFAVLIFKLSR